MVQTSYVILLSSGPGPCLVQVTSLFTPSLMQECVQVESWAAGRDK